MTVQSATTTNKRAGAAIVDALEAEGVQHVFGLVGSHVLEIYDALLDSESIRHITCKHENTASGMADAYGRLTGRPGVVLVTAGPGATNSLTGVVQAYMSASPLIHISGAVPRNASYESFHGADNADFLESIFRDVTKWSVSIQRPEDIPGVFANAYAIATSGRPGPVHIEIPQDVLLHEATEIPVYESQTIQPVALDRSIVDELAARIRESKNPVIWAGKGVKAAFADAELVELAELLQAPVITSGDAAGAIPDIHPLSTGQLNLYARTPLQKALASEADLVIAVGERGGTGHADGMFALVTCPVAGIWTGNDGEGPDSRSSCGQVADIKAGLNQLVEALGDQQRPDAPELRERIRRGKDGLRRAIRDQVQSDHGDTRPMHYGVALEALVEHVDDDVICMGDIGSHNQWTRLLVETRNRTTYIPEGFWGAMGYGLPAAMAAKLLYPEKKVLTVTGDGCFLMASADFSTAVENGINPVVVILNDRQYGMIVGMQQNMYGRKSETALEGPDFVAFARSFGGDGMRVETPEQMAEALGRGFKSDVIFVIDAICDYRFPNYDFDAATRSLG
ncbi:acetolactate synthase large subunit [soil metagenome]